VTSAKIVAVVAALCLFVGFAVYWINRDAGTSVRSRSGSSSGGAIVATVCAAGAAAAARRRRNRKP
jgi:hypothetical protein